MAVITDAKIWSGQQIGRGCWLVPELAHMGAAKVTGNEAVHDHGSALPLARSLERLGSSDNNGRAGAG